jgi:hypothetical protein
MPQNLRMAMLAVLAVAASMPAWGQGRPAPTFSAKVPSYITTPDTVQTRIGTLNFFDGLPDPETVQKVYDNLDFVEARRLRAGGLNVRFTPPPYGQGLRDIRNSEF